VKHRSGGGRHPARDAARGQARAGEIRGYGTAPPSPAAGHEAWVGPWRLCVDEHGHLVAEHTSGARQVVAWLPDADQIADQTGGESDESGGAAAGDDKEKT
jgi:hypothetical protein